MNTFDVFDTLLARRHITSDPVWQQMEREYNIPGFIFARKNADTGTRDLQRIYNKLVDEGVIVYSQQQEMMNREIELEISISFPVQKNIDRVQHGDVLISDMYLPAHAILQLVRSVGLDKQVTLYQSNGDKSNGSIWSRLQKTDTGTHLGDNRHSDYDMPTQAGVKAEWFEGTGLTQIESQLFDQGLCNLALLCREIRLRNNPVDTEYFNIACDANLPLLFVLAEMIHRKRGKQEIVFLGRDCQLLHKVYNAYYGIAYYIPFSRKVAYAQPNDAVEYLKAHSPKNSLYVDISSTGGTWAKLAQISDLAVLVAIYSDVAFYTPERPVLPEKFDYLSTNTEIGQTNLLIELFNCGDHGHLGSIEVIDGTLMRSYYGEPELPISLIKELHLPAKQSVELSPIYAEALRAELTQLDDTLLKSTFGALAMYICNQTHLLQEARDFLEKETEYLEQFTNENT